MSITTIHNITIMGSGTNCSYSNNLNSARFSVHDDNVFYHDPFGNYMTNSPRRISINFEVFKLQKMGDRIEKSNGTVMIMMPKEEIQQIANKTFYKEGQFHAIDFTTFIITEKEE